MKILIVDDDQEYIRLYKEILSDRGLELLGAQDPDEALTALKENKGIGMVLLDYNMPGVDNKDLVHSMRNISSDVKILINSNYPIDYQMKTLSGVDGYNDKFCSTDDLLTSIKKILNGSTTPSL